MRGVSFWSGFKSAEAFNNAVETVGRLKLAAELGNLARTELINKTHDLLFLNFSSGPEDMYIKPKKSTKVPLPMWT